jgi:hypothetical protein
LAELSPSWWFDRWPEPELNAGVDNLPELYRARIARFEAEADRFGARSRLVSNLRGLTFGIAVIAALFAVFGSAPAIASSISVVAALAFASLVVIHLRVINAEDDARRWARVNHEALARCTGGWRQLPADGKSFSDPAHPYTDDLDVFGPASLFQRMSVAHTRHGQQTLAEFFRTPASVETIKLRQEAARVLAPELDLRQRLEALALAVQPPQGRKPSAPPDPEALLGWAESQPVLWPRRGIVWAARVLPPLTVMLLLGSAVWGLPSIGWALPLAAQLVLTYVTREQTARVFGAVSSTQGAFLRYGAMLELIERIDLPAQLLQTLRERLVAGKAQPSIAMKEFRTRVGWFDLRHNGLVHPFVNVVLLWDIHCVLWLEAWQRSSGRAAREWLIALGQLEALSSLAGLAHDEPGFVFPEVLDAPTRIEAEGLGHPLIDSPPRVGNDVTLKGPGSVLLVTGSNMSGKSTLLRSMGLGAVMALAGAPVCATRLTITRCAIRTSIRVSDSLEGGVSHFYAELRKLKAVLDATAGDLPVLFLLDEILHGTNSRERQIGARWLLSELIAQGAMGAASTHDMGLTRLPEALSDRVELVHFRESVKEGEMTFDYRLRGGPVMAGNALRLMRLVGLHVPLE